MKRVLVTGGAGFIGSHFVERLAQNGIYSVVLDKLTYAGHPINLEHISRDRHELVEGDISDARLVRELLLKHTPDAIVNFAAESHVDRSIESALPFIQTNIVGTFTLLEQARKYWESQGKPQIFRFVQISTDEVFGSLGEEGFFTEKTPYDPRSPYSASKASADHLALSFEHTYGLPVILTHCTNNYGPRQYPEKLIPFMVRRALSGEGVGVYGDGRNVRDWIYVGDHCQGIHLALEKGKPGQRYCFGGASEMRNIELVHELCDQLDRLVPRQDNKSYREQIQFVKDRPGHDWRYAVDDRHAQKELGFKRNNQFQEAFAQTLKWYVNNQSWMKTIMRS